MEKNEKNEKNDYRVEKDSIGAKDVPENVYYGVQSLRAAENFHITGLTMHPEFINSLAYIKKAAAITNCEAGLLDKKIAAAIVKACDEIIDGRLHDYFIVDPIQGGAGTSMNMNANEVIANRAIDILGGTKGDYSLVHPNDHVNYSQSTNDVIPTAGKMTALRLLKNLKAELFKLHEALIAKAKEFDHVIKMGRTQMQDAVPIRLGQEFQAYADAIMRDVRRMDKAMDEMRSLNMGGTAVGTGINADELYLKRIVPNLSEISDMEFVQAFDLIDATQNLDPFVSVSGAVKACAVTLSKMANDLRLMSSGPRAGFGEINLPAKQNGSSIMPGKVNPVIPEVVNQVAFYVIGNDNDHHYGGRGRPAGAERLRAHYFLLPVPVHRHAGLCGPDLRGQLHYRNHSQRGTLPLSGGEQRGRHHRDFPPRRLPEGRRYREKSSPHRRIHPQPDSEGRPAHRAGTG